MTIKIGDIEIYLIQDALTHIDAGGMFGLVPKKLWSRYKKPDENNCIPSNGLCLLVKSAGQTAVVDTGLSIDKLDDKMIKRWGLQRPRGHILDALGRAGLSAEDIDVVIDTHLHSDHCAGNTRYDADGQLVPTFPNAKYVVQRREYDDAMQPNERTAATYIKENYEPLYKAGQMELLDGDTEILHGVWGVVTPGHTPGHMSIIFDSNGEHAMFLCDLASMAVHFERLAWMTAYDVEPLVTLETKRIWQQWALEHDALLFVVHDAAMPVARLRQDDEGRLHMDAVEYEYL